MTAASPPAGPGPEHGGLQPSLGLFTTIMLVVGGVIGSGIFRKPGVMAAQLGAPEWLLAVWALAGLITLFGALTNAEVASMIPETGGQYVWFARMYGPFFAFLYGWAVFSVMQSASICAVAYVFAEYATRFVPLPEFGPALANWSLPLPAIGEVTPLQEIGTKGLAAALILLLTAVNHLGVRLGGLVQNLFTIAKVAALLLLVLGAFLLPTGGRAANWTTPSATGPLGGLALVAGIAAALQGAFWAYDGWNKTAYIAGEVKQPQRNIPLALIWGMLVVTALYLVVNAAYAYVLPIDEMARSKLVAADVAERLFRGGGRWIAAAVMLSTFGTVNAIILATARVYFAMARARVFPRLLGVVHPRFHTPVGALWAQGVWSVLLLFSGTFDSLTDTLIFVSWIFYAAGAGGVLVLRHREPATPRPYKVPGYPFVPWVFLGFSVVYLGLTLYNDLVAYRLALAAGKPAMLHSAFGLALVLLGTPVYFLCRGADRQRGPTPTAT